MPIMQTYLAVVSLLLSPFLADALPSNHQGPQVLEQQPLIDGDKKDLIHELRRAEIIPTVIDTFTPKVSLSIFWPNATAEVGNTISPDRVQKAPEISFITVPSTKRSDSPHATAIAPNIENESKDSKPIQLTLALTDPDAPSRDNPEWSEICHWIITNVPLASTAQNSIPTDPLAPSMFKTSSSPDAIDDDNGNKVLFSKLHEIMPYKPPGPPPKTGKHRYVFVALAPKNGTSEPLDLQKPGDRQHWGFGKERKGVRDWAERMGLEVIGANFIYAQNDEQ